MNRLRAIGARLFAVVLLSVVVACGDPGGELVDAALVTIDDLPSGFRSIPVSETGPQAGGGDGEQPSECDAIDEIVEAGPTRGASSDVFTGGESAVMNDVVVYDDERIAVEVLRVWSNEDNARPCIELLLTAIVGFASSDPFFSAAVGSYEIGADPLDVAAAGDEHLAWRGELTLQGREGEEQFLVDVMPVRVGRIVATFIFFGPAPPAVDELRSVVVDSVVGRLTETAR